jgi:hypothetical protein
VLPPAGQVEPPPTEPGPWASWRVNNRTNTYGISSDHSALQLHTLPDLPCSLTRGLRALQLAAAARRRAASDHFLIILNSHLDDRERRRSEAFAEWGFGGVPGPVSEQRDSGVHASKPTTRRSLRALLGHTLPSSDSSEV